MKLLPLFILLASLLFPANADHLLLTRVVTQPDAAESISIHNPTDSPIDLSNYYICDDEEYYKMQTEGTMTPSHFLHGFTARFPQIFIPAGDTLHIILNENYSEFYGDAFIPDLVMYGSDENSMLETDANSFGLGDGKIDESSELIILFKWDGDTEHLIEDVDYFLWGQYHPPINKTEIPGYQSDSIPENQYFDGVAQEYYAYSRIGTDEVDEIQNDGNGITGHDETSENFRQSWEMIELFNLGCMDEAASNYDSDAEIPDGSCEYLTTIYDIIHNCGDDMGESIECSGEYDLSSTSAGECPLYEETITTSGVIVDYFDVTVYNGPYSFTIESQDGYRIDFVVWPESSSYQDGFDVTQTDLFTQGSYNNGYLVKVTGKLGAYCDDDEQLDIFSEWQVTVEYESDIVILDDGEGEYGSDNIENITITPAPFAMLPSLGETLDYSYSFPNKSRVIIRIYDLSGRFITSLIDKYYSNVRPIENYSSTWDGRDQLGQIVSPGTYIMHMEVMNPVTGETQTDAAPIVIGVKN